MKENEMGMLYAEEATALNAEPPIRFVGMHFDYPMFQQNDPGVGSFVIKPGEKSVKEAYDRACVRWKPVPKEGT